MRLDRLTCLAAAALACSAGPARSQSPSIADLSLEQLAEIQVVAVGKRAQRLADVAGSVYVITGEDIRRSGATTLPEALRLAPNLHVARAGTSQYAVTARTGLDTLANKMLVLLDGRTIYSPLFSGVFWEAQDVAMADIDRIEILSGSGGTLYGSNAFHGVIHIRTKAAQDTQGALVHLLAGPREQVGLARYGAHDGGLAWRLYARQYRAEAVRDDSGAGPGDATRRRVAGFRTDYARGEVQAGVQGEVARHEVDQAVGPRRYENLHLLARYAEAWRPGERWQVQAYLDRSQRNDPATIDDTLDTVDVEAQHQKTWAGNVLVWGGGIRQSRDRSASHRPAVVSLVPPDRQLGVRNLFGQHEATLGTATRLTLGLKAEDNTYTGLEWLPNVRIAWEGVPNHLLWAAASRVVRLPARIDREALAPPLVPSPAFDAEVAHIYEAGWRGRPAGPFDLSATLFRHDFRRLRTFDFDATGRTGRFDNRLDGRLQGLEAWAQWHVSEALRLRAGGSWQHVRYEPQAGTAPVQAAQLQGNDPRHDVKLVLSWNARHDLEVDLLARHVGALPDPIVPAYTAIDLHVGWRVRHDLQLAVAVRNANGEHVEWSAAGKRVVNPRSAFVTLTWQP